MVNENMKQVVNVTTSTTSAATYKQSVWSLGSASETGLGGLQEHYKLKISLAFLVFHNGMPPCQV